MTITDPLSSVSEPKYQALHYLKTNKNVMDILDAMEMEEQRKLMRSTAEVERDAMTKKTVVTPGMLKRMPDNPFFKNFI